MDDTAQNTTQNIKLNTQNSGQGNDAVGSVAKEHGPASQRGEPIRQEAYIQPSGAETQAEVSPELQEHGVEAVVDQEKPQLTEAHTNIGLRHAKESVPAPTKATSSSHIKLPMTEEEADQKFKTTKVDDSDHWFAALVKKVYRQLREAVRV